ncbi:putative ATP-dependent DNA helicase CHR12 [Iris pallida]|uniref:DNA helicase n=1 Tax=Iris pallida TaxID=29817 RepID=A0AAX6I6E4_IRIPA|nr:putative ATP-dependent DNA helicase CHR12 [Iris pallida]
MSAPAETSAPVADEAEKARTLIGALNLISRNLPLPPELFRAVSSIYHDAIGEEKEGEKEDEVEEEEKEKEEPAAVEGGGTDPAPEEFDSNNAVQTRGNLMKVFEDALLKQQEVHMSGSALRKSREHRFQSLIKHRLSELEGLPSSMGEDLQMKCLLELYGLKLVDLQRKVRSRVNAEYWLHEKCAFPDKQLFDWGMMRLRHPFSMYGIGDTFAMEADDRQRKKRDIERLSRLEEEEKNRVEIRKRKFFADLLNTAREFQLQAQAAPRRRKQRNDYVQAWHGRQRQRATRAEKLRYQALKADDQEAYMRMVEESKNERLTMLLGKTNELLVSLGAAVQRQKDAEQTDAMDDLEGSEHEAPLETSSTKSETQKIVPPEENTDAVNEDSSRNVRAKDLLEGQRQYNFAVHSIQEKVTEQPSLLEGGELRPYQLEGLQWMLSLYNNNLNGILADEMGLGKTIQTISLIAYLLENKGITGPHLIIAPKAVLPNWANEFATWVPSIVAVLYDGRQDERKVIREEYFGEGKYNVILTHYDLIMRDKAYLKKIHWHYMIVDEGHRLKNHECALAKTVAGYRIRRRLLLTGTPIQNSLQELWSLLNFLLPHIFNSVQNFEEWFNAPFADRCEVSLNDEEELLIIRRLHHVLRPFLLRRKKDEVEKYLPSKIQVILKCDLSAWQKAYYQQVTDIGRVGLGSATGKSKSLQNLSMQLRKCCNHPYLFVGEYNMWQKEEIVRASGKFELLDRLLPKLKRAGHRVLLFSQMTKLMDILEIYLQLHGFKYMRLDGSTKTEERGTLLKQFNAPESSYFMFLLSTRAGGLGLNLQTADTVIMFDMDWNPQMDQQAEDRAHRIGQKKEVRVFVLVSVGSIEEEILERAKQKMGIDAKVIQAGLFNTTSTADDRKEMLQEIMRRGTSRLGTDVPSEREINRLAARTEEEFWLFEKMDEERRQKERYRSRLMEEKEVPDWVFPKNNETKVIPSLDQMVTGKRRRKEVVYADQLSDYQWMKAVEDGEDFSNLSYSRKKRRESSTDAAAVTAYESASDDATGWQITTPPEQRVVSRLSLASEDGSDDIPSITPRIKTSFVLHSRDEARGEGEDDDNSNWRGNIVTWKTHRKKRSSHPSSSSEARGL